MRSGAIIAAAGITDGDKSIDPMTAVGGISAAQRAAAVLSQAGIERIVFITGHNGPKLEKTLSDHKVVTLYNVSYKTCDMCGSVNLGLNYLADKCDRVLVMPVGFCLFAAKTAEDLLADIADITVPSYEGKPGHPVALSAEAMARIIKMPEAGGFGAAIHSCGMAVRDLPTSDKGVTAKVSDLPDEPALLDCHNSGILRSEVDLAVSRETHLINGKSAALLERIDEFHSVALACRCAQMSYSAAWMTLKSMEKQAGCQIVSRTQGGAVGGGRSELSPDGRKLLESYRAYERELRKCADSLYSKYFDGKYVRRIYLVCAGETLLGDTAEAFSTPDELPLSTFGKLQGCLLWRELSDKGIDEIRYVPGRLSCQQTAQLISDSAMALDIKASRFSDGVRLSDVIKESLTGLSGNTAIVMTREDIRRFLSELSYQSASAEEILCGSYAVLSIDGGFRLFRPPVLPHPELGQILCTRMLNTALADEHSIKERVKSAERRVNEAFCLGDDGTDLDSAVMLSGLYLHNGGEIEAPSQWLRRIGYDLVARRLDPM